MRRADAIVKFEHCVCGADPKNAPARSILRDSGCVARMASQGLRSRKLSQPPVPFVQIQCGGWPSQARVQRILTLFDG